jgi:hypothetical protein
MQGQGKFYTTKRKPEESKCKEKANFIMLRKPEESKCKDKANFIILQKCSCVKALAEHVSA